MAAVRALRRTLHNKIQPTPWPKVSVLCDCSRPSKSPDPRIKVSPMIICAKKNIGLVSHFCALVFALLACESIQAQKLDLNSNGMSDVWEQIYNAAALNPNLDSDGDGVSNLDRKSTRLNSSHMSISYAVFCLKKKKKQY